MNALATPTVLCWYSRPAIEGAAAALRERAQAGLLGPLDLAAGMLAFCFRDREGRFWFLDAWAGRWHVLAGGEWQAADAVPEALEGPAGLPVERPLPPEGEPPLATATAAPVEATAAPVEALAAPVEALAAPVEALAAPAEALAAAIGALRAAYARGQIDSAAAAALLAQRFLVDRRGRAWTVGAQSGRWYAFEGEGWTQAAAPPDPGDLARLVQPAACPSCGQPAAGQGPCPHCGAAVPAALEGVSDEGYRLLLDLLVEHAGLIPEEATAPWTPPPGYPNLDLPAVSRTAPLRGPQQKAPQPALQQEAQEAPRPALRWFLRAATGPLAEQPLALGEELRIGRGEDNDLTLPDAGVSRHHAAIRRSGEGYTIVDLGSTNGTVVNGQRIAQETPLRPGDEIALHDVRLAVVVAGTGARCPACGAELRPGLRFCPNCGRRVGA